MTTIDPTEPREYDVEAARSAWADEEKEVAAQIEAEKKAHRLTLDELQMIRLRFEAAEKGPWLCDRWCWAEVNDVSVWGGLVPDENGDLHADSDKGSYIVATIGSEELGGAGLISPVTPNIQAWKNGLFIAHARQDMERLYKHLEWLEWRIEVLEERAKPPGERVATSLMDKREESSK